MPAAKVMYRARASIRIDGRKTSAVSAFTLVDLLVSLTVIAVIISLMLPSISTVRELSRRVVCASNARQHGLALTMYADDYQGAAPTSQYAAPKVTDSKDSSRSVPDPLASQAHLMLVLRVGAPQSWDGLGRLYASDYLTSPQVFYCPSHTGEDPFGRYASTWSSDRGALVGNYQFRGGLHPDSALASASPQSVRLSDGLRSRSDFNHKVGANLLRADSSVQWFGDTTGAFARALPATKDEVGAAAKVEEAWQELDEIVATGGKTEKK